MLEPSMQLSKVSFTGREFAEMSEAQQEEVRGGRRGAGLWPMCVPHMAMCPHTCMDVT